MNGYSKLRFVKKSRSIDFSDLCTSKTFPHQTQKIHQNIIASGTSETDNQYTNTINQNDHDQSPSKHQHQHDEDQAACSEMSSSVGAKYLSENYSVSSATSSQRLKLERQRSTTTRRGIQSAFKRAFSLRRSSTSSVSHEKYCRIHDQCVAILLDDDDIDEDIFEAIEENTENMTTIRSMEKKKCGNKFLKSFKRIFGL